MTDFEDVRATVKALSGEQVAKELAAFNAFYDQFGGKFFDAHATTYYNLLSQEMANRERLQAYSQREKARDA